MYGRGAPSTFKRDSRHPAQAVGNQVVGLSFYPFGDVSVRGSAMGRIVFEAAESWRVMRWCDEDPVRETGLASAIVGENRVGVYPLLASTMTSTPFAASTSRALAKAGSESACVSMPM